MPKAKAKARTGERGSSPIQVLKDIEDASLERDYYNIQSTYFWQFAATFLPLAASPLGLLGNLSSIVSIADKWRIRTDGSTVSDRPWILAVNSLALASGCISNVVLFLNFNELLPEKAAQIVSITGYFMAVIFYLVLFIATEYMYYNAEYHRSQGYWQGAGASILYFISSCMLLVNLIGHLKGKYTVGFHLSKHQRRIMVLIILFIVWVAFGAAVAQHLLNINYADATYFCLVACLTLGFGDILAVTVLSRALLIPYIYVGIVLMGLTAITLYQAVIQESRMVAVVFRIKRSRQRMYAHWQDRQDLGPREAFDEMRRIVNKEHRRAQLMSSVLIFAWLLVFWLGGALIFKYTEKWTYFNSFYFCSIALAAVGFGDFVPTSALGRSVFIIWSFLMVPTMATFTSNLSSLMFSGMEKLFMFLSGSTLIHDNPQEAGLETIRKRIVDGGYGGDSWTRLAQGITLLLVRDDNELEYPYEIWNWALKQLLGDFPPVFWLSDDSPIKYVLDERKCLLMIVLHCLHVQGGDEIEDFLLNPDHDVDDVVSDFASSRSARTVSSKPKGHSSQSE